MARGLEAAALAYTILALLRRRPLGELSCGQGASRYVTRERNSDIGAGSPAAGHCCRGHSPGGVDVEARHGLFGNPAAAPERAILLGLLDVDHPSRNVALTDRSDGIALVRGRIGPGGVLPWHTHDVEEALTVLQGTALSEVGDEKYNLAPGDAVLLPAHVGHQLSNVGQDDLLFVTAFSVNQVVRLPA